jgi:NADH:ubiquinone oxidoreductase subunit K
MNLLFMNLSHYIRRPALILLQLLFMGMTLPLIIMTKQSNFWPCSLCGFAMIGGIVYGYQMEILSKPFSFMLPGHRRIFRHLIFLMQAFWLLLGAILVLCFLPQDMLRRVLGSIILMAGGSLAFRLGIGWADKTRQPQAMIGMMVPVIVFGSMLTDNATVEKVLFNPFVIVGIAVLGGIVTFRMWRNLGQLSLFASYCGVQNVGFFSGFPQQHMQKARQQQIAKVFGPAAEDFMAGFETFFLRRIEHTRHKLAASFAYGAIYQGLAPALMMLRKHKGLSIIWMFGIYLLFGYYGKMGDILIWLPFLLPVIGTDFGVHSTLLMTRGRLQRYIAAMTSLLFTTITALGIVFVFLGLMRFVEPFMPAIHLRGLNAEIHTLDWRMWYLLAIGVPVLALLRLLFWAKNSIFFISSILIMQLYISLAIVGPSVYLKQIHGGWIALSVITVWAAFAAYLYRVCFRKSLAVQR